ncbi:protein tiptop-like [Limulus polyphemus]|uniref:Protein tiptop-like n=1 Tax=Limulus polyphemus TaxID=6850 RepID=A0ABM1AZT6_LIMPO|nr:protein tiptop-like [Limulus polyphemus]
MPRRKQDRPKRMKWEDGDGGKMEVAGDDSSSSGCDVAEGHDTDEDLIKQTVIGSQSTHTTDVTLPPIQAGRNTPNELSHSETNIGAHSSTIRNLDCTPPLTSDGISLETEPMAEDGPIDFSLRNHNQYHTLPSNLSPGLPINGVSSGSQNEPLDLSVPNRRKSTENCVREIKLARVETLSPVSPSAWSYSPRRTSSEVITWNGKMSSLESSKNLGISSATSYSQLSNSLQQKTTAQNQLLSSSLVTSNMVTALDKMNTLSHTVTKTQGYRTGSRQNPWQNQWINKSGEQAKDVFTCVWCKESFKSLADMTIHMQQSPKCGMAGMQSSVPSSSTNTNVLSESSPSVSKCSTSNSGSNMLMKESVPLPRKLVRGQDVWLGKGAEQTRQILKCMWCGQSFKTLADMTNHMRVTQHYNNIISQEQIISWKVPVDKMTSQSQINAVLTCKVCNQVFGSLKELSYHMMKNAHYKEHILRSITESGGRRRQTRERRKKSLPVRKLLELERMEMSKLSVSKERTERSMSKSENVGGKITCEECAEKVEAKDFVTHIKNCTQNPKSQYILKNTLIAESFENGMQKESKSECVVKTEPDEGTPKARKSKVTESPTSEKSRQEFSKERALEVPSTDGMDKGNEATSVLSAIEKLIEKSFENRSKSGKNGSTGILQRLGIDEEVYPPWHPPGKNEHSSTTKARASTMGSSSTGYTVKNMINIKDGCLRSQCIPGFNVINNNLRKNRLSVNKEKGFFDKQSELPPSANREHTSPQSFTTETKIDSNVANVPKLGSTPFHESLEEDVPDDLSRCCSTRGQTESPLGSVRSKSPITDHAEDSFEAYSEVEESNGEYSGHEMVEELCDEGRFRCQIGTATCSREAESPDDSLEDKGKLSPSSLSNSSKLSLTDLNHETEKSHTQNSEDAEKPTAGHPLRELQKLLDKTDVKVSRSSVQTPPGSILAFSWACSDATTSDSLMKCAFCDTHFISKGAYRHHLSKMHFVKESNILDNSTLKASSPSGGKLANEPNSVTKESPPLTGIAAEESPHSKFLKYTELAKQLSSKYV